MEKYNGWTNRSTWAVHLWITNEEQLYFTAREARFKSSSLKLWFQHIVRGFPLMKEDCEPLDQVNWDEVSEALKAD